MAERTTLAAVAAEVAAIRTRLDQQAREDVESTKRIRELLDAGQTERALEETLRPRLVVVKGTARRRTARRGKLRLVS
jgi:hypothetical protein